MTEQLRDAHAKEVNVDEKEDSDDYTTAVRGAGPPPPPPPAIRGTFAAIVFAGKPGGGVRQRRCCFLFPEGQYVVHRSTRLYARATGGERGRARPEYTAVVHYTSGQWYCTAQKFKGLEFYSECGDVRRVLSAQNIMAVRLPVCRSSALCGTQLN